MFPLEECCCEAPTASVAHRSRGRTTAQCVCHASAPFRPTRRRCRDACRAAKSCIGWVWPPHDVDIGWAWDGDMQRSFLPLQMASVVERRHNTVSNRISRDGDMCGVVRFKVLVYQVAIGLKTKVEVCGWVEVMMMDGGKPRGGCRGGVSGAWERRSGWLGFMVS